MKKIGVLLEQIDDAVAQENAETDKTVAFTADDLREMAERLDESMAKKEEQGLKSEAFSTLFPPIFLPKKQ